MSLQKSLTTEVLPTIVKEFAIANPMAAPRIEKIVVTAGIGNRFRETKDVDSVEELLAKATGQKPVLRRAKKSVSNFKLREGMPNALQVTLRRERMWSFLERLVNIALPRVRDFRGLPTKFDGRGNFSFGLREANAFPEAEVDDLAKIHGLGATIVIQNSDNERSFALLSKLGFPFRKKSG